MLKYLLLTIIEFRNLLQVPKFDDNKMVDVSNTDNAV